MPARRCDPVRLPMDDRSASPGTSAGPRTIAFFGLGAVGSSMLICLSELAERDDVPLRFVVVVLNVELARDALFHKAEAMQHHQQGVIEHINPGPLRDLEDGWKQQFGHLQGLQHATDARAIGKTHDPQPNGTPRLNQSLQVFRRFQWNQPWASRLEQHGAEQGGAAPPMDEQLAGQTRRPFLKASRTQGTWGRSQHGGESASQCCKSHPVETMPL